MSERLPDQVELNNASDPKDVRPAARFKLQELYAHVGGSESDFDDFSVELASPTARPATKESWIGHLSEVPAHAIGHMLGYGLTVLTSSVLTLLAYQFGQAEGATSRSGPQHSNPGACKSIDKKDPTFDSGIRGTLIEVRQNPCETNMK